MFTCFLHLPSYNFSSQARQKVLFRYFLMGAADTVTVGGVLSSSQMSSGHLSCPRTGFQGGICSCPVVLPIWPVIRLPLLFASRPSEEKLGSRSRNNELCITVVEPERGSSKSGRVAPGACGEAELVGDGRPDGEIKRLQQLYCALGWARPSQDLLHQGFKETGVCVLGKDFLTCFTYLLLKGEPAGELFK